MLHLQILESNRLMLDGKLEESLAAAKAANAVAPDTYYGLKQEIKSLRSLGRDTEANLLQAKIDSLHASKVIDDKGQVISNEGKADLKINIKNTFESNDFENTITLARNYLKYSPISTGPHSYLILALENLGRTQEALDETNKAIANNPKSTFLDRKKAALLLKLKNPTAAIEHLNLHIKKFPDDSKARYLLAAAQLSMGHYDDALKTITQIKGHGIDNTKNKILTARIHLMNGNNAEVVRICDQILASSFNTFAMTLKAQALFNLHKDTEALSFLQRASETGNHHVLYHYASALIKTGKLPKGREVLTRIQREDPSFMPANLAIARINYYEGNYKEALKEITSIITNPAKNNGKQQNIVAAYLFLSKKDKLVPEDVHLKDQFAAMIKTQFPESTWKKIIALANNEMPKIYVSQSTTNSGAFKNSFWNGMNDLSVDGNAFLATGIRVGDPENIGVQFYNEDLVP